jgi:hydrogenase nickel incorporation protein HypA/HybF
MHELGIAQEALRTALDAAGRHGAGRVTRVGLRVGALRAVIPENLAFLFGHAAAGTIAEGAQLAIEEEPLALLCPACGARGESRVVVLDCPACGAPGVRLSGGEELRVVDIDIDAGGDADPAGEAG